jgi:hypothetical protein
MNLIFATTSFMCVKLIDLSAKLFDVETHAPMSFFGNKKKKKCQIVLLNFNIDILGKEKKRKKQILKRKLVLKLKYFM